MPTEAQMREFLRRHYKAERFEGRDGPVWGDYSAAVTRSHLADLAEHGTGFISQYESVTGKTVKYDASLTAIPA